MVSPFCETVKLLRINNLVVFTKHGNISIEAAWKKRFCVFSATAPYSSLFSRLHKYHNQRTLRRALITARSSVISGKVFFPSRVKLARYQAMLDFHYGQDAPFNDKVKGGIHTALIPNAEISSLYNLLP